MSTGNGILSDSFPYENSMTFNKQLIFIKLVTKVLVPQSCPTLRNPSEL